MKSKIKIVLITLFLFMFIVMFHTSCIRNVIGEGEIIEENRNHQKFSKIELDIDAEVYVTYDTVVSVIVKAQQNISDVIETSISGKTLRIKASRDYETSQPIELIISMNKIEEFKIIGSGIIKCKNTINAVEMDLEISGSGKIYTSIVANKLTTDISGSGDVFLKGNTKMHKININGSGNLMALELVTDESDIMINGSGDARVNAIETLDVNITGSGDVKYVGSPKKIKKLVSGSGNIEKN